jgi:Ssu72-like protein
MQKSVALVCASNQNRSLEAHDLLKRRGFDVSSYGTSSQCKLPGPSADKPNTFAFGTPYEVMYETLKAQNHELYLFIVLLILIVPVDEELDWLSPYLRSSTLVVQCEDQICTNNFFKKEE